jgi:hypothetical protein
MIHQQNPLDYRSHGPRPERSPHMRLCRHQLRRQRDAAPRAWHLGRDSAFRAPDKAITPHLERFPLLRDGSRR